MDWYLLSKFLHVGFAILWLGGAMIMVLFGVAAERARNDAELVSTVLRVAWAGDRIYVPSSVLTLIFGLLATWIGGLWSEAWVLVGLLGIASTIALGVLALGPRAKQVKAGHDAGGAGAAVLATSRELLTIAKFDLVVLFTIVAVMVFKPGFDDWGLWLLVALVVAGAGALFLRPLYRQHLAAA